MSARWTTTERSYTRRVDQITVYEAAGGMAFFEALVDRFYEGVAADPVLLRLYPDPDDLAGARHRLRHAPFAIGPEERDRWLTHMRAALDELAPSPEVRAKFDEYFPFAAESMRNRD
jgi:hemoglobin